MEREVEVDPLEVVDPDPPELDRLLVLIHRWIRPSPSGTRCSGRSYRKVSGMVQVLSGD